MQGCNSKDTTTTQSGFYPGTWPTALTALPEGGAVFVFSKDITHARISPRGVVYMPQDLAAAAACLLQCRFISCTYQYYFINIR